jgi:2-polyprenyl-3-methyl-5-hydroxy-6-metoxy-1,4-benzoquinol methylase
MNNAKPAGYHSNEREEMLRFIPNDVRFVLEVGCGGGIFGSVVKRASGAEVWGIEIDNEAASAAKAKLDKVIIGDVRVIISNMPDRKFDCIVFNDVLEHLVDPFTILIAVKSKLTSKGVVVCSIPNIRYFPVLRRLVVNKQWKYEDWGVLDRTHLRFFTKKSIIDAFNELNYEILQLEGINGINSWKFNLLNMLLLGNISDTRYMQFACVVLPK